MISQQHIDSSITAALANDSLPQYVYDVRGFSTKFMRNLFHEICNIPTGCTYLEIGLFCGGTFLSSFNKNTVSIGIENHSQDFSEGFDLVKKELKDNVENHKWWGKEVQVHYDDCFNMDLSKLPDNIDIFFFDGEHSFESQAKALPYFIDKMADRFIMIVDDFNWDTVFNGTNAALQLLQDKITIEYGRVLRGYQLQNDPIYHNGISIYLISKK